MGLLYPLSAAQPEGAANPSEERGLTQRLGELYLRAQGIWVYSFRRAARGLGWHSPSRCTRPAATQCLEDSEWKSTKAPLPVRPIVNVRSDVYRLGTQVSDSKLELNPQ